jgi:hypothetical protein
MSSYICAKYPLALQIVARDPRRSYGAFIDHITGMGYQETFFLGL